MMVYFAYITSEIGYLYKIVKNGLLSLYFSL